MTERSPGSWTIDLSEASDSIKNDLLLRELHDYDISMWCRVGMFH